MCNIMSKLVLPSFLSNIVFTVIIFIHYKYDCRHFGKSRVARRTVFPARYIWTRLPGTIVRTHTEMLEWRPWGETRLRHHAKYRPTNHKVTIIYLTICTAYTFYVSNERKLLFFRYLICIRVGAGMLYYVVAYI